MEKQMKMQCLFCKSDQFELPREDYQPSPGETIKCKSCGRLNDYSSMLKVVEEHAIEMARTEAEQIIKKAFKSFKLKLP